MKKYAWRKCRKIFLSALFSHSRKLFFKFWHKILSSFYVISLAQKTSYCLSASHNPELRCVICTGVKLFVLSLHLNCTAFSQSESSIFYRIFYMQTRQKGQFGFAWTLSPRLNAFLNKRIFDRKLNYNNS